MARKWMSGQSGKCCYVLEARFSFNIVLISTLKLYLRGNEDSHGYVPW